VDGTLFKKELDSDPLQDGPICSLDPAVGLQCVDYAGKGSYCFDSGQNPRYGSISFDNLLHSLLQIVVIFSGEGWSDIMFFSWNCMSRFNTIVYILLLVMGYFIMSKVIVAVLYVRLNNATKELKDKEDLRKLKSDFQRTVLNNIGLRHEKLTLRSEASVTHFINEVVRNKIEKSISKNTSKSLNTALSSVVSKNARAKLLKKQARDKKRELDLAVKVRGGRAFLFIGFRSPSNF
jgi:hypothetical protein